MITVGWWIVALLSLAATGCLYMAARSAEPRPRGRRRAPRRNPPPATVIPEPRPSTGDAADPPVPDADLLLGAASPTATVHWSPRLTCDDNARFWALVDELADLEAEGKNVLADHDYQCGDYQPRLREQGIALPREGETTP